MTCKKIKIRFTSSIKGSHPNGDLDFIGGHFLAIFSWIEFLQKKLFHFAFTIAFWFTSHYLSLNLTHCIIVANSVTKHTLIFHRNYFFLFPEKGKNLDTNIVVQGHCVTGCSNIAAVFMFSSFSPLEYQTAQTKTSKSFFQDQTILLIKTFQSLCIERQPSKIGLVQEPVQCTH